MRELFWRYNSSLDISFSIPIRTQSGEIKAMKIRQRSNSPVDTIQHEFKDIRNGITHVTAWIEGTNDSIHFDIKGRYYSEARDIHISLDSSTQTFLIPNTEHGMPNGWGELIYLTPNGSLWHIQVVTPNIGDFDQDGVLEIFDPFANAYARLDPASGKWVTIELLKH
jgi:hypothetical protein